jgi:hypothetical protein
MAANGPKVIGASLLAGRQPRSTLLGEPVALEPARRSIRNGSLDQTGRERGRQVDIVEMLSVLNSTLSGDCGRAPLPRPHLPGPPLPSPSHPPGEEGDCGLTRGGGALSRRWGGRWERVGVRFSGRGTPSDKVEVRSRQDAGAPSRPSKSVLTGDPTKSLAPRHVFKKPPKGRQDRFAEPEEIALAVLYLASGESLYVTERIW